MKAIRSFLMFAPVVAVVTTIDREHLDQYSSLEDIQDAFPSVCKSRAILRRSSAVPRRAKRAGDYSRR